MLCASNRPAFLWYLGLLLLAACLAGGAAASPADSSWRRFLQPDKSVLVGRQLGDELLAWYETKDGLAFVYNPKSRAYEYAIVEKDGKDGMRLAPSGVLAGTHPGKLEVVTRDIAQYVRELERAARDLADPPARGDDWPFDPDQVFPTLVIRVSFADVRSTLGSDWWRERVFGPADDSLNAYYDEVSGGAARFDPALEIQGAPHDGIVDVKLRYRHPLPGHDATAARRVVADALDLADKFVDFAHFDADGDDKLSSSELQLIVVLAGPGTDDPRASVWPHASSFVAYPLVLDGVVVAGTSEGGTYVVVPEFHEQQEVSLGVMAHEIGHSAFHLPDLYDGDDAVGDWGLMGTGCHGHLAGGPRGSRPTHLIAACKVWAGFVEPDIVLPMPEAVSVDLLHALDWAYRPVIVPTQFGPGEFLMLEHRRIEGFDAGLTHRRGIDRGDDGVLAMFVVDRQVHLLRADGRRGNAHRRDLFSIDGDGVAELTPDTLPGTDHPLDGRPTGVVMQVEPSPLGDRAQRVRLALGPFDACATYIATNPEHERAGRAYSVIEPTVNDGVLYHLPHYYAAGSDDRLGAHTDRPVALHGYEPGFYFSGLCPGQDSSAPEIDDVDFGGMRRDIDVYGTVFDAEGDLLRVDVAVTEGEWRAARVVRNRDGSSFDFTGTFPGLGGGLYATFVRAIDAHGNVTELEPDRRLTFSFGD